MRRRIIEENPEIGREKVVYSENRITPDNSPDFMGVVNRVIWAIITLIDLFLVIRIIFKLLNARPIGFADLVYNLTDPIVAPFNGIFPTIQTNVSYLDIAAIIALIVVAIIGWIIVALLGAFSRA